MESIIATLSKERAAILDERSKITAEIERLGAEQSHLSDRLFHIEKLLASYGSAIQSIEPQGGADILIQGNVATVVEIKNVSHRPSLLPQFEGYSLIESIGQVMSRQPENIFSPNALIGVLFVSSLTNDQYATAKRSLTAELSRGAKEGRWYKLPKTRGKYRFDKGDIDTNQPSDYRSPKELKRSQFKKMGYIDICSQVLSQHPEGMSLDDLTTEIFTPGTDLEREKAQASLSVELNRAIREKRLSRADNSDLYCLPINGGDVQMQDSIEKG